MNGNVGVSALPKPLLEGVLERLSLPDLLQSLSTGDPCQVLLLAGNQVKGFLWLAGQKVVRVRTHGKEGERAFLELFEDGNRGGFKVFPLPWEQIPIHENVGDLTGLLLQAASALDEWQRSQAVTVNLEGFFQSEETQPLGVTARQVIENLEKRPGWAIRAQALIGSDSQATVRLKPAVNGDRGTVGG